VFAIIGLDNTPGVLREPSLASPCWWGPFWDRYHVPLGSSPKHWNHRLPTRSARHLAG